MRTVLKSNIAVFAWSLAALVVIASVIAWGELRSWSFSGLNEYALFPLFGLIAFSLMWTHYITYAVRIYADAEAAATKKYSQITSYVVLAAIIMHPALFIYAQQRLGLGVPPESYEAYVGASNVKYVFLGVVAWLAFMAYELKHWLSGTRVWRPVVAIQTLAMVYIFIHGLQIGQHLQSGWYQSIWFFYGATLLLSYVYLGFKKRLF